MWIFMSSHTPLISFEAPREAGGVPHHVTYSSVAEISATRRGCFGERRSRGWGWDGAACPSNVGQCRQPCQSPGQGSIASRTAGTREGETTNSSGVLHLLLLCLYSFCSGIFKLISTQAGARSQVCSFSRAQTKAPHCWAVLMYEERGGYKPSAWEGPQSRSPASWAGFITTVSFWEVLFLTEISHLLPCPHLGAASVRWTCQLEVLISEGTADLFTLTGFVFSRC